MTNLNMSDYNISIKSNFYVIKKFVFSSINECEFPKKIIFESVISYNLQKIFMSIIESIRRLKLRKNSQV